MSLSSSLEGVSDKADLDFWRLLRQEILPLRPSQYDLTSRCNLTCEGCLFFSGSDYLEHEDASDLAAVDAFFAAEAHRGVRYGYFGGAEPSMVQQKLMIAARHLPYGVVFTNGTQRITNDVPYRIHVSVWGKPERSRQLRGADILKKQLRNYRGDPRAIFVLTITAQNLGDIEIVAAMCADNDVPLTFNHYSPTKRYMQFVHGAADKDKYHAFSTGSDNLLLEAHHLQQSRETIAGLLADRSKYNIIYDQEFNALIHRPEGLYEKLTSAGEVAIDCGVRLTSTLHHVNTDLSRSTEKCCTPNIECRSCRLYAQSFATVLARATRDLRRPGGGQQRMIQLWRLWCNIFMNDDRFRSR